MSIILFYNVYKFVSDLLPSNFIAITLNPTYMAAQLPDVIVMNKEKMQLYSNPLETYWIAVRKDRPTFQASENCKRGYIATWEIHDQQLYLRDVQGSTERKFLFFTLKPIQYSMRKLFRKYRSGAVKAKWFTGKLRIPKGAMTAYDHDGYNSRFEQEMIITVDRGDIKKIVTLDYKQQALIMSMEAV
jgi:hypothetical protein